MSSITKQLREGLSDRLYGKGITLASLGSDQETDTYIQEKFEEVDANAEYLREELLKEIEPSTESDKMDFVFNQVRGIDSASK